MAYFDLIYLETEEGRTMSCGVFDDDGKFEMIGPFPAREAGPKIVEALLATPCLQLIDKKDAENAYMVCHFRNMNRGENAAGTEYPMKVS